MNCNGAVAADSPMVENRSSLRTKPCEESPTGIIREVLIGGSNYRNLAGKERRLQELTSIPMVCLGQNVQEILH